jgi:hypothetical protein
VGSRAGLDAVVKRKIHSPRRESNPRTPISSPYKFIVILAVNRRSRIKGKLKNATKTEFHVNQHAFARR